MKLIITFLIAILFANCKQTEENKEIIQEQNQEIKDEVETVKVEENILKNFTYEDVARFTMASVMGQPAKIIKATKSKDLYFVSYIRKFDKQSLNIKSNLKDIKFFGQVLTEDGGIQHMMRK